MNNPAPGIMVISNKAYIPQLFVTMCSLFENNDYNLDIYLLTQDISDEEFQMIETFFSHWKGKRLIPLKMSLEGLEGLMTTSRLPAEMYFRLTCVDRFPKTLSKVLSLDLDMIVKGDISDALNTEMNDAAICACKDIQSYIFYDAAAGNIKRLGLPEDTEYFNAGFMMLNLDCLRKDGGSEMLLSYAYKYNDILEWLEQDILNLVYHNNRIAWNWYEYNCPPIRYIMKSELANNGTYQPLTDSELQNMSNFDGYSDYTQAFYDLTKVIHYTGSNKPWSENRPKVETYRIFDQAYFEYAAKTQQVFNEIFN